eukprot:g3579.t1
MTENELDAIVLTTQPDVLYYSGFETQFWQSPTRPFFLVVPNADNRDPIAVFPEIVREPVVERTWLSDVRTWTSPRPADDGVSLLVDTIDEISSRFRNVGFMLGPETHLRMPHRDAVRVTNALRDRGLQVTDASTSVVRRQRSIKSSREIEKVRHACALASDAFEALPRLLLREARDDDAVVTERDVVRLLRGDLVARGIDSIPYMIAQSGPGGYRNIVTGPTDRVLEDGDVVIVDTGAKWDGYFCDFDRNFLVGDVEESPATVEAHEALWYATERAIDVAGPGVTMADLHAVLDEEIRRRQSSSEAVSTGRSGHELGLELTEGASVTAQDETVLRPGMVVTIEPGTTVRGANDGRMLVHEENIVITETGAELLSRRAPLAMARIEGRRRRLESEEESGGGGSVTTSSTTATTTSAELPPVVFSPEPAARLAFVQIASDVRLDVEAPPLLSQLGDDVAWRFQKLPLRTDAIDPEAFAALGEDVRRAAATFRPKNATVLGLACTSLSFCLGPDVVRANLLANHPPGTRATDMCSAVTRAVKRFVGPDDSIALLTPYVDAMHARNVAMFREQGVDVAVSTNLGLATDEETSAVSQEYILDRARDLVRSDASGVGALVVGCSAFRACTPGFIDRLEDDLGLPVVTSQQAFLWDMLREAGVDCKGVVRGYGELLFSEGV